MSSRLSIASVFALAFLSVVDAAAAPAGQPIQFQITNADKTIVACLDAQSFDNGAAVDVINCNRTFPSSHEWTVDSGGVSSGTGPATQIRIDGNKCLDVTNGLNQNGNKLQIWDCVDGNTNQMWNVNGDGSISWAGRGKCVDLTNGDFDQGTRVQIWDCVNGNTNQKWNPVAVPLVQGELIHWNANSDTYGLCLSASENKDGAPVQIHSCGSAPGNTTWAVPASGSGSLQTFNDKCLDVTNGVNADGTKLQIFTCVTGNTNQRFETIRNADGVQIQWMGTNKCLDVTNGVSTDGNPVQIWTCGAGNPNQQWFEAPDF